LANFYVRQQNASSRILAIVYICQSVHLSVTLVICIQTVYARITKSLLWDASRTLVFSDKISCPWDFPRTRASNRGTLFKRRHFAAIGSYSLKTVADRYRLAA